MKRVITITLSFNILDDVQRFSESFQEGRWNGGILYMKKRWGTPMAMVEEFEANEYVAACWGVACDTTWSNNYELTHGGDYWNGVTHDDAHCGNSSNQVIRTDDDGNPIRMVETGTDGLGTLNCTIYWDENYTSQRDVSTVAVGNTIYWTTSADDGRTWNHMGTVFATAEGHPNRS